MDILKTLEIDISKTTKQNFQIKNHQSIFGGDINQTIKISNGDQHYFVKINEASLSKMFTDEIAGLNELRDAQSFRIPDVICTGSNEKHCWLVLEYIELRQGNNESFTQAGHLLAKQHQHIAEKFGYKSDNRIGSSKQSNQLNDDWSDFWKTSRLSFQLNLAINNGFTGNIIKCIEELILNCHYFLNHNPTASLLHGDLWSGNLSFDNSGTPVMYDPAIYYGDRETDIAMTELFGGFSQDFYLAYQETFDINHDYQHRKTLYNLYHILNHMNLFGGSYESQAETMANRLLSEIHA